MEAASSPGYVVRPMPRERQPVLDRLAGASRRFPVHALVELDVTEASARISPQISPRASPRSAMAAGRVSWTGFVIATMARAIALHPELNARRAGNRILYFDDVDIGTTVERHWEGHTTLDVLAVRAADRRSCADISSELRRAKHGPALAHPASGVTAQVLRLPGPMRRAAIRLVGTRPNVAATFGPAVGVTSIGMFSHGWGWAIPLSPLTVMATVGGVLDRPTVRDGRVVARPMLPLTLTFDHAVVDGAPAARFVETLRELAETAAAFEPLRGQGDALADQLEGLDE